MTMPGFVAEHSLVPQNERYRTFGHASQWTGNAVTPQVGCMPRPRNPWASDTRHAVRLDLRSRASSCSVHCGCCVNTLKSGTFRSCPPDLVRQASTDVRVVC